VGGAADSRSDIYGLGCVLYEMLAGQAPFTGPTTESVVFQHLNAAPPRVTAMRPAVPAGLEQVIVKAMAKSPADRYATTAEFEAALTVAPGAGTAAVRREPRWVIATATALALVTLVALAAWQRWGPFERWLGGANPGPVGKRDWLLVAEFEGPAADSTTVMATHDLLSAALDQSRVVQTVPRSLVRDALRAAGKPGNARLDAELAREIAYRRSVRAVLEGRVGRLGSAYTILVDVVDADSGRVILNRSVTAKDERALVGAVEDLSKRLRKGLGENSAALRSTRPMNLVMTPSFEAYRLFAQGSRLATQGGGIRRYLAIMRAALAVDTAFASAWVGMAYQLGNLGYPDSVRYCIEQAYRHPERLTDGQKQSLERARLSNEGDTRGALALYDRILEENPSNYNVLANSNDALLGVGRIEDAVERTRRAMSLSPFGPSELMRINLTFDLFLLGRFDEAREAARHQSGNAKTFLFACIEMAAGRWAAAESIGVANLDERAVQADLPGIFLYTRSVARFARGGLRAASSDMAAAVVAARAAPDPASVEIYQRCAVLFSDVSGRLTPLPSEPASRDTALVLVMTRGLRAAVAGDAATAKACLATVRGNPAGRLAVVGVSPAVLEGRVALLGGRPEDAIGLLRPLAQLRIEPGFPMNGLGLNWARWVLADAFERTGRPDSAAACLENALVAPSMMSDAIQRPFMRHRLALLYARMGRVTDAERHLAAVEQAWDHPDPAIRRMLDEARAAVASARGMARPERGRS